MSSFDAARETRSPDDPSATAHPWAEMLTRAAAADPVATREIIAALTTTDPTVQLGVQTALQQATDQALWERLLEAAALGRWGDLPLTALTTTQRARRLRLRIRHAFLPADAPSETAKVAVLQRGLRHPAAAVRRWAADLLGERAERAAAGALLEALNDPDTQVRLHAIRALGRINGPEAIQALTAVLQRPRHDVFTHEAMDALIAMGGVVTEAVLPLLQSPDDLVRWTAARVLAEVGTATAVPALVRALADPDPGVRWLAANGLARLAPDSLDALLEAVEQQAQNPLFRQAAAHALHHVKDAALRRLLQPLEQALLSIDGAVEAPVLALNARRQLTQSRGG